MADHGFDQRAFQALGVEECRRLLAQHHLSRIGLVDADGPLILPVNYVLHRLLVVFRTEAGTKLDAAVRGARSSPTSTRSTTPAAAAGACWCAATRRR